MRPADFDAKSHGHAYHFAVTGSDKHSITYLVTDSCADRDTDGRAHAEPKPFTISFTYAHTPDTASHWELHRS